MAGSIRLGDVNITITGNSSDFRAAAKSARAEVYKLRAELAKIKAAGRTALFGLTAVAGGAALLGRNLADGIDNLGKLSTSLRTSVKDLQALEQAALLQGVAWKQVEKGIINLRNVLGEISSGAAYKTQTDAWKQLGLRIEDVINLDAAEQVKMIGQAIKSSVAPAEQLSVAAELVGKKAALGFLRMADEVDAARDRLDEFDLVLSQRVVRNTEAANDALGLLGNTFLGVGRKITAEAAPGIKEWADRVMQSLKPGGDLRALLEGLANGFSRLVGVATEFAALASKWVNTFTLTSGAIYLVVTRLTTLGASAWSAVASLKALNAAAKEGDIKMGAAGLAGRVSLVGTALSSVFGVGAVALAAISIFREFWGEADKATTSTDATTDAINALKEAYDGPRVVHRRHHRKVQGTHRIAEGELPPQHPHRPGRA